MTRTKQAATAKSGFQFAFCFDLVCLTFFLGGFFGIGVTSVGAFYHGVVAPVRILSVDATGLICLIHVVGIASRLGQHPRIKPRRQRGLRNQI